jgi:hypothetical protein
MKLTAFKVKENMERAIPQCIVGWIALLLHFMKDIEWSGMTLTKVLIRLKGSLAEMPKMLAEITYA